MRKKFLIILAGIMIMLGTMAPTAAFAEVGKCADPKIFGLDAWYSRLTCKDGEIAQSNFQGDNLTETVGLIAAVVVKDLLFIAGFVAVGFVMYGGFLMITSAGNPGAVEKGKKTISGALIGLVISILAYAIVTFILTRLGMR
jgi:hypothetical protein